MDHMSLPVVMLTKIWCPSGSELTHWPLGDLNVIFKNVIFNIALLIGIFKSYDNMLR